MSIIKVPDNFSTAFLEKAVDISDIRSEKILTLRRFYNDDDSRSFFINGDRFWLDIDRLSMLRSVVVADYEDWLSGNIEHEPTTKLYSIGETPLAISIKNSYLASVLLNLMKYYVELDSAMEEHRFNMMNINDINALQQYDMTVGKPENLSFKVNSSGEIIN